MTRSFYLILLLLPCLYFLISQPPFPKEAIIISLIYVFLLQAIRLRYKKVNFYNILLSYTPFGIKYWSLLWKKD